MKRDMGTMKRFCSNIIVVFLLLSTLIGVCSCYSTENVGPIPNFSVEEIEYIDVFDDANDRSKWVRVNDEDVATILGYLASAMPYRESVQDAVYGEDYRALNIRTTEDKTYRCYIYKKWGKTLLEMPYIGIYKVDGEFFSYLDEYI